MNVVISALCIYDEGSLVLTKAMIGGRGIFKSIYVIGPCFTASGAIL